MKICEIFIYFMYFVIFWKKQKNYRNIFKQNIQHRVKSLLSKESNLFKVQL